MEAILGSFENSKKPDSFNPFPGLRADESIH